jgi:septum formation protein
MSCPSDPAGSGRNQRTELVLASGSPRRRELLAQLGLDFAVAGPDVDETPLPGERPVDLVRRLAVAKAVAVDGDPVLAADTVVDVDGEILGKPADADDARRMLRRLSGRSHRVHTAVALRSGERVEVEVVTTIVTFVPLQPAVIEWYVGTGEPLDKAGAYAVQGAGGVFVERVRGSVSNVVGLPLTTVAHLLDRVCGWRPGPQTLGWGGAD